MKSNEMGIEQVLGLLRRSFDEGKLAILAGAGILGRPASRLPLAQGLVEAAIDICTDVPAEQRAALRDCLTGCATGAGPVDGRSSGGSGLPPEPRERSAQLQPPRAGGGDVEGLHRPHHELRHADRTGVRAGRRGAALLERYTPTLQRLRGSLLKLHGSIGEISRLRAAAVEDIMQGLAPEGADLLDQIAASRPLLVVGYSGADDFDLYPWLLRGPCKGGLYSAAAHGLRAKVRPRSGRT